MHFFCIFVAILKTALYTYTKESLERINNDSISASITSQNSEVAGSIGKRNNDSNTNNDESQSINYVLYNNTDSVYNQSQLEFSPADLTYQTDSTKNNWESSTQPLNYISGDQQKRHEGKALPFSLENTDFVFVLMLICLLFFTHMKGADFFKQNLQAIISPRRNNSLTKNTTGRETIFSYLLAFQTIILASVSLFNELVEYSPDKPGANSPTSSILIFILVISCFFILKLLGYKLLGYVFDKKEIAYSWIQTNITILEVYGLILFIPTLILIYGSHWHLQIVAIMLILLIIGQIIVFYRIVIFFLQEKLSFLFLIVYLCSLELIPYLLLVGALVYLYSTDVLQIIWH